MTSWSYLVTGAAGFIGSHSVDRLLMAGHRVIGVDNFRTGHRKNLDLARTHPRFRFYECDIGDPSVIAEIFDRARADSAPIGAVLHLAALVSVPESIERPAMNFELNLQLGDRIARACIEQHCQRLVFASSAAIYGDRAELPNRETLRAKPQSPYAGAKLASEVLFESYAATYGLSVVCFRYFNIYGPRQNPGSPYSGVLSIFSQRFREGLPIVVHGDGEQTRDFVAVRDVAEANALALTRDTVPSGVYNVCTGQRSSLNEVIAHFRQRFPDSPTASYGPERVGDIRHSVGDPEQLRRALGFSPQTPLTDGLDALIDASAEPTPIA